MTARYYSKKRPLLRPAGGLILGFRLGLAPKIGAIEPVFIALVVGGRLGVGVFWHAKSVLLKQAGCGEFFDARQIADAEAALISGELQIFQGPILDNEGTVRIPEGEAGGMELLDTTDWLVEGVIGQTE